MPRSFPTPALMVPAPLSSSVSPPLPPVIVSCVVADQRVFARAVGSVDCAGAGADQHHIVTADAVKQVDGHGRRSADDVYNISATAVVKIDRGVDASRANDIDLIVTFAI